MLLELITDRNSFRGLVSLVFGVLILLFPKILNYLIALYFILNGLALLLPHLR